MSNQESYWEKLIRKQSSSGVTATRFCAEHRIGIHKFKYWQKKLKLEEVPGKFMQVYPEICKETNTELIFPNGIKLIITSQTDLSVVKKIQELFS